MSIQELEAQLLSLDQTDRVHLLNVLTQSLDRGRDTSIAAWNHALQQLQQPPNPQALAELLQSWEDEGDPQEQQETWEFLQQALEHDRLSNRPLFP